MSSTIILKQIRGKGVIINVGSSRVTLIPVVIGVLGTVPKDWEEGLEES